MHSLQNYCSGILGQSCYLYYVLLGGTTLEQIPEGAQPPLAAENAEEPHANGVDKPKKEPLLARLSHGFKRRASGDKVTAADGAASMPVLAPAVAAH